MPDLTLVIQVKTGNKKCYYTCIYRNASVENNSTENVNEITSELIYIFEYYQRKKSV